MKIEIIPLRVTPLQAGHALIFDDMMNERMLENGYVPTNLAHRPKVVTPVEVKPLIVKEENKNEHAEALINQPSGEGSGFDKSLAEQDVEAFNKHAEPAPYSPERISAAASKPTYDKPPSLKNYPPNINVGSLDLWPEFFKKYGKTCKAAGTLDKQWACCIAIWRNYTMKRRKSPFDSKASYLNQDTQDYMLKRMSSSRKEMNMLANRTLRVLKKNGFITKVLRERIVGVEYSTLKKRFNLTTGMTVRLTVPFKSSDFKAALKAAGYAAKLGTMVRSSDKGQDIVFAAGEKENSTTMMLTQYFNEQQVKFMIGASDEDLKNRDKIIRKLAVFLKNIVKEQPLDLITEVRNA